MNPFFQTYVTQINQAVVDLSNTLEEYERRLHQAQDDKEEKMKEWWAVTRQAKAMRETLDRMPALEEENACLREKNSEALERVRRILDYAKALSGSIER
ncbi:MAG: hypothetical protein GXY07_20280 [Candidatus Hydrogenedentes bacterium]|nr:hypothetical protein [Candidatus Hydrogenedentota bacterium]